MTVATASYAVTQSYTSVLIQSSSFASSSVSASYALNSTFADSALYSEFSGTSSLAADAISSSYALSASYAPFVQTYQTNTVSSSWASSSLSSSYSNLALTASYALSCSYLNPEAVNSFILPFQFKFSSTTTLGNPGTGNFRYNSNETGSITNIYVSKTTSGGIEASVIFKEFNSGSTVLYIQEKDDSTKSSLFGVTSNPIDNGDWYNINVAHLTSSTGGLPKNNQGCAWLVYERNSLVNGQTYPITSSWAVSASWAPGSGTSETSSYSLFALTASYALNAGQSGGTTLTTGSFYPITSSWAVSASWAPGSGTSQTSSYSLFALTASYVNVIPSGSTESASYALTASYASNIGGLSIPPYDYSNIIYSGPNSQIGKCTYRIGGISGSIVAEVTAIYNGNLFIGVSKSLG
jgi:hypothetical protein